MIRPAKSPITMHFGATDSPYSLNSPHKGTDFAYLPDDRVYAPANGIALIRPLNGNDGNAIYISDAGFLHGLLHLATFLIPDNTPVKQGQVIGIMGATGKAEGKHLHHALKLNGVFVDAEKYYEADMAERPLTDEDRTTIHNITGASMEELKNKADWHDVYYAVLEPKIKGLDAEVLRLRSLLGSLAPNPTDPDGEKWRQFIALNKEIYG